MKGYVELTKPGIVKGNTMAAIAGFLLASQGVVDFARFAAMLVGVIGVIASACVFNNYIDRDIDKKMSRTKKRALVTGSISGRNALIFASILFATGVAALLIGTTLCATGVAVFGFFAYVVLYGVAKRHSVYGTEVGSISGAIPPVIGYSAVTGSLDVAALLLFLTLVIWQMPHFYAIGIFRRADYKAASIPILPVESGVSATKRRLLLYVIGFTAVVPLLFVYGYTGYSYLVVMVTLSLAWLGKGIAGYRSGDDIAWARKMFGQSLVVLVAFCVMISLTTWLP